MTGERGGAKEPDPLLAQQRRPAERVVSRVVEEFRGSPSARPIPGTTDSRQRNVGVIQRSRAENVYNYKQAAYDYCASLAHQLPIGH
jgi:hypothetical protein